MTAEVANDGGNLRGRFVDAALEILQETDTSLDLRKVAERAGRSRTAPYLAFGKTEEGGGLSALQLAVAAEGFRKLADRMDQALLSSRNSEEGLRGLATAYLAFARDEPRLFRLMFGPDVGRALSQRVPAGPGLRERTAVREARADTEFVLLTAIGMETQGYLRSQNALDPADLAGAVWAMLHGVAMLTIDEQWDTTRLGRLDNPEELASRALQFLTTASSEKMKPARDALMEALLEKGMDPSGPLLRPRAPRFESTTAEPLACFGIADRAAPRPTPSMFDSSAIRRARGLAHRTDGARILWIDDEPERSTREAAAFTALGMQITRTRSTHEALARLEREAFDLIISDIAREDSEDEGVRALPLLLEVSSGLPVIFYIGTHRQELGAPLGSFGITNDPEELMHLVFDALERGAG